MAIGASTALKQRRDAVTRIKTQSIVRNRNADAELVRTESGQAVLLLRLLIDGIRPQHEIGIGDSRNTEVPYRLVYQPHGNTEQRSDDLRLVGRFIQHHRHKAPANIVERDARIGKADVVERILQSEAEAERTATIQQQTHLHDREAEMERRSEFLVEEPLFLRGITGIIDSGQLRETQFHVGDRLELERS